MEKKILDIMSHVFQIDNVTSETSQINCEKWDSLNHLNLIVELESEFDLEFEPEDIAKMRDFDSVKEMIESKL